MLDVHAPHEKLEGVKDFALHIFTITVGLLIALGLEGCVERYQKAELRRQAETNLRLEITDNRKKLGEWQPVMQQEEKTLSLVLDFIAAKKAGKPFDLAGLNLGFSVRRLSDASWRTASATGALALLDYEDVQGYAGIYQVQDELMQLEHETLDDFLQVQSYAIHGFDPAKVSAEEAAGAEPDVRRALSHLEAMEQIGVGMATIYDRSLQQTK
jgi:hypothetical protein